MSFDQGLIIGVLIGGIGVSLMDYFFELLFKKKVEPKPVRDIQVLITKHTANNKKENIPPITLRECNDTLSINQGKRKQRKFLEVSFGLEHLILDVFCDSYYKKLKKKK